MSTLAFPLICLLGVALWCIFTGLERDEAKRDAVFYEQLAERAAKVADGWHDLYEQQHRAEEPLHLEPLPFEFHTEPVEPAKHVERPPTVFIVRGLPWIPE